MKTEEIKILLTADQTSLNRGLSSATKAVLAAKGVVVKANGEVEASSSAWSRLRSNVVGQMQKMRTAIEREQAKMKALELKPRIGRDTPEYETYGRSLMKQGYSDRQVDTIMNEAAANYDQYNAAAAAVQNYTAALVELESVLAGLNAKVAGATANEAQHKQQVRQSAQAAREAAQAERERAKASAKAASGLGATAKSIGLAMIGARTLYAAVRKLISATGQMIAGNSQLSASLSSIKGNLSIAFGAIFSAALPALQKLLSFVNAVTNAIAQFTAALFGVSWKDATKAAKSYGTSAGGAAKSAAEEARKAQQTIAGLDELNLVNKDEDSSGGGGGGGGGGATFGEPMKLEWVDKVIEWFKEIKAMIPQEAIDKFKESWEALKEAWNGFKESEGLQKLLDFVQRLLALGATITIYELGTAFQLLADVLETLTALMDGDWGGAINGFKNILLDLADSLMYSVLPAIDEFLGTDLTGWWTGVSKSIREFDLASWLETTVRDFSQWVKDFPENFKKIDWHEAGYNIGHDLGTALSDTGEWLSGAWEDIKLAFDTFFTETLPEFVKETIPKAWKDAKEWFSDIGGDMIDGLILGWNTFWDDLDEFIDGLVEGFKSALGIASPSTVFEEIGENVAAGLLNGILAFLGDVGQWVKTHIIAPFEDAIDGALVFAVDVKNDAAEWWKKVKQWWGEKVGAVADFVTDPKNQASKWWENVKLWWSQKVGYVSDFRTAVRNDSATWWSNVKSWWNSASGTLSTTVKVVKGWAGTVREALGIPSSFSLGFNLPKIGINWGSRTVAGFTIKWPTSFYTYAQGGFPDIGEMFIAREAGPEMVGRMGSKSAVANNEQIVTAVAQGVYQAVLAAMGGNENDGEPAKITITLDGKVLYEGIQKVARGKGVDLGMGAFANV